MFSLLFAVALTNGLLSSTGPVWPSHCQSMCPSYVRRSMLIKVCRKLRERGISTKRHQGRTRRLAEIRVEERKGKKTINIQECWRGGLGQSLVATAASKQTWIHRSLAFAHGGWGLCARQAANPGLCNLDLGCSTTPKPKPSCSFLPALHN